MFLLTYYLYSVQNLAHSFIDESARAYYSQHGSYLQKFLLASSINHLFMKVIETDKGVLSYIPILKIHSDKPLQNAF